DRASRIIGAITNSRSLAMVDLLTAVSILVATGTWLVTYLRDRSADRIAHTAAVITNLSTSDRLAESSYRVTRLINAGARVSLADVDSETEAHVVGLLDYYEFVCDLSEGGVISEHTLVELRGRLMLRTWEVC